MSEYLPAGGTDAAFDRDFGTSRWQLNSLAAYITGRFGAVKSGETKNRGPGSSPGVSGVGVQRTPIVTPRA
jgi:hypothetical protein